MLYIIHFSMIYYLSQINRNLPESRQDPTHIWNKIFEFTSRSQTRSLWPGAISFGLVVGLGFCMVNRKRGMSSSRLTRYSAKPCPVQQIHKLLINQKSNAKSTKPVLFEASFSDIFYVWIFVKNYLSYCSTTRKKTIIRLRFMKNFLFIVQTIWFLQAIPNLMFLWNQ